MESTSLEYVVERYCDLTQIGGLINAKGYGIAMRKSNFKIYLNMWKKLFVFIYFILLDSPLLSKFNEAVLNLQESGKLNELRNKWWMHGQTQIDCPVKLYNYNKKKFNF